MQSSRTTPETDEAALAAFVGPVSHVLDRYALEDVPMWSAVTPLAQTGDVSEALPADPTQLVSIERAMVRWRMQDAQITCMPAKQAYESHCRHRVKTQTSDQFTGLTTDPSMFTQALAPAPERMDRTHSDSREMWCAIDSMGTGEVFNATPAAGTTREHCDFTMRDWTIKGFPLAMMPVDEAVASMTRHLTKGGPQQAPRQTDVFGQ